MTKKKKSSMPKHCMVQSRFPRPLYRALLAYGRKFQPKLSANKAMVALAYERLRGAGGAGPDKRMEVQQ